jgi:hypothetical protein
MAGDWIKLHRKLLDSAVFSDEWLLRLWVWCLLRAGYCDRMNGGKIVPAGSFVTGRFSAADELNVSPSRWYRGIHQLASLGMITLSASQERTIVSVCNWTTYQEETAVREQQVNRLRTASEQQVNNDRTTIEQQTDTSKEGKEGKESSSSHDEDDDGSTNGFTRDDLIRLLRADPYRMTAAKDAVDEAIQAGCQPSEIREVADFWRVSMKWSRKQLHFRIKTAFPGDDPTANWPPPDPQTANGRAAR